MGTTPSRQAKTRSVTILVGAVVLVWAVVGGIAAAVQPWAGTDQAPVATAADPGIGNPGSADTGSGHSPTTTRSEQTPSDPGTGDGTGDGAAGAVAAGALVTIIDVVDGDTIDVRFSGGRTDTVRLIGIDAPEAGTCAGQAATEWSPLFVGMRVRIVADPVIPNRGYYDRLLRYVRYDGGTDYGRAFLRAGWDTAKIYNDPPHHLVDTYAALDAQHDRTVTGCGDDDVVVAPAPAEQDDDHHTHSGGVPIDDNTGSTSGDGGGGGGGGVGAAPGDLDCAPPAGGVVGPVPVAPGDPDRLDGDGIGCE